MVKKGLPCGDSFIKPTYTCHQGVIKFLDKIKKSPPSRYEPTDGQKRRVVTALEMATKAEQREIMRDATNRLRPEEARAILNRKMPGGETLEEYANSRGKDSYNLPGQKQRVDIKDDEVDLVWDSLKTLERNLLVPAGAGAPERERKNNDGKSLVDTDWGTKPEDKVRMRKAMLKTLLEQLDEDGNLIDPWTGKAFDIPADLDHIKPVAAGGGHGIAKKGEPKSKAEIGTDYNSENWVWTSKEINRNYKSDNDIYGTVQELKLATNKKAYELALDKKIKFYLTVEKERLKFEDDTREAAFEAFNGSGHGLNSFPSASRMKTMQTDDLKSVMKGLQDADPGLAESKNKLFDAKGVTPEEKKQVVIESVELVKAKGKDAIATIRSKISSLSGSPFSSIAISPSITFNGTTIKTPKLDDMLENSKITINDLDDDSYVNLMLQLHDEGIIKFDSSGQVLRGDKGSKKGLRGGFREKSIQALNDSKRQLYTEYIKQDKSNKDRPKNRKNNIRPLEDYAINQKGLTNLPSYDEITPSQAHTITNDIRAMTGKPRLKYGEDDESGDTI